MDKAIADLLYLCGCAVNEQTPERERVEAMDAAALWDWAGRHKLTATVAAALEALEDPAAVLGAEEWARWADARDRALRRTLLFEAERGEILAWFEEQGIWYLPLKGIWIQHLYPRLGMREMADNDILYDEAFREQVRDFMTARGYSRGEDAREDHFKDDGYYKEPFFNFELHFKLFWEKGTAAEAYYRDVSRLLLPEEGTAYGRRMSTEDEYIYVTAHAYRHYSLGGIGLRTLVDTFLLNRQSGMRRDYLEAELSKLELTEFEACLRELSEKLFARPGEINERELNREQEELLAYMAASDAYGSLRNRVGRYMEHCTGETRGSRWRYLRWRLFPEREWVENRFPLAARYPVLLPIFYPFRWVRGILFRRRKLLSEMHVLFDKEE